MSRQDIITLFARRYEAYERHDATALAALHAEACVLESPTAGGTVRGRQAIEQVYRAWFTAFPDVVFTQQDLLVDGDRAAEVVTAAGTDTGGFMGLPSTGRPFHLPMVILYTFEGQAIVQERRVYDFTGMLVQIGVLKAKPA